MGTLCPLHSSYIQKHRTIRVNIMFWEIWRKSLFVQNRKMTPAKANTVNLDHQHSFVHLLKNYCCKDSSHQLHSSQLLSLLWLNFGVYSFFYIFFFGVYSCLHRTNIIWWHVVQFQGFHFKDDAFYSQRFTPETFFSLPKRIYLVK